MTKLRSALSRLGGLFRREERDSELRAELESHLQMHIDDYLRSGMAPEEARRQALIKLGGVERITEAYRRQRGLPLFETLAQDVRFAIRTMYKNLGFTCIAVVTLALGIGVNTALFSVVNGVLLNPLPYPQPDQLVIIYSKSPQFEHASVSYPNYLDWEKQNRSFSSIAAYRDDDWNVTGQNEAERLHGYMISSSFFSTLGVAPVLGRTITREEDRIGGAPVVLIGEGLWRRKFGGSATALGRTMILNGVGYTIVGVIPAGFRLYSGDNTEIYLPLGQWTDPTFLNRRVGMGMRVLARLKPGISVEQARADGNSYRHARAGRCTFLYEEYGQPSVADRRLRNFFDSCAGLAPRQ